MSTGDKKNNPFPIGFDTAGMVQGNEILRFPLVNKYMRLFAANGRTDFRNYDLPYLAGYSKDWVNETPYIFGDRDLKLWPHLGKNVDTKRFLIMHEQGEKSVKCALEEASGRELQRLLILLKMTNRDDELYFHTHGFGTWMETYAVRLQYDDSGLAAYNIFMDGQVKRAEDERIRRVPATLDMGPYQGDDREDTKLRRVMEMRMAA
jgi:hypothetical protein